MAIIFVALLSVISTKVCCSQTSLRSGDLLFVKASHSEFSTAIDASTAIDSAESFDHVAIAYRKDSALFVIEATPKLGVSCRPYAEFLSENGAQNVVAMRYEGNNDTNVFISKALSFLGKSYDFYFLPDNGEIYCSELVYLCYTDSTGKPLFSTKPMNFRAPDGTLPDYWTKLYRSLGVPVPEGVQGTNPNDMSRNPHLKRLW